MNISLNKRLYLFALALVIYEFTMYAANDMIMPAMPKIVNEFKVSVNYIALTMIVYMLGNSLLQLFLGPFSARFGNRKIIILGNISFLIFTILLAFTININMFLFFRLLQGTGLAFIAMGYVLIHDNFNDEVAVKVTSLMANISILAPVIGPVIGGVISNHASWRYVFICSGITGIISLIGLIKYTPQNKSVLKKLNFKKVVHNYWQILLLPKFLLGSFAISLSILPILLWIAISPTIIMHTLNLSVNKYMIYQVIATSGFLASSLVTQFVAGRVAITKIIRMGAILSILSLVIGFIFYDYILIVVISMFFLSFGIGQQIGTMFRIIGKLKTETPSMLFSMLAFIQNIILVSGINLSNNFLDKRGYLVFDFMFICFIVGVFATILVFRFVKLNLGREWQ
ncbi:MAG TPA: MFS transporter [Burkholderiales bacterium]|nr:MFS transporter [Burkholderiales bacterium]